MSFVVVAILAALAICPAAAQGTSAYTFTVSTTGGWTRTQDAYLPAGVLLREVSLKTPEDLVVTPQAIYVADAGNGRIVLTKFLVQFLQHGSCLRI